MQGRGESLNDLFLQVTIGSIAAALLGFAGSDSKKEHQPTENLVEIIALILLPVAVLMVGYALMVFVWRSKAIAKKQVRMHHGDAWITSPQPFNLLCTTNWVIKVWGSKGPCRLLSPQRSQNLSMQAHKILAFDPCSLLELSNDQMLHQFLPSLSASSALEG